MNHQTSQQTQHAAPPASALDEVLGATEAARAAQQWQTMKERAQVAHKSGFCPSHVKSIEAAQAIAMAGEELGIPLMTALRVIYYFDGKISLAAQLMVALAIKRVPGFAIDILKTTSEGCWAIVKRPGWEPVKMSFTLEDAVQADLGEWRYTTEEVEEIDPQTKKVTKRSVKTRHFWSKKDNWRKYPKAMCLARLQASGVRAIAPEAALGVMSEEERQDSIPWDDVMTPEPTKSAEPPKPAQTGAQALAQQITKPKREPPGQPPAAFTAPDNPVIAAQQAEDPAAPPAGFPKPPKAKAAKGDAKQTAPAPAASSPAPPTNDAPKAKPVLPDPLKGAVGDTYENEQGTYKLTADPMGVVRWELVAATSDGEPPESGAAG